MWQGYVLADYAWIPGYHQLQTKIGIDYFTSHENFGSDGVKSDLTSSGQLTTFKEYKFWAEAEYGFVKDWSALLKIPITSGLVDTESETLFSGSGLSDVDLGLKWNLLSRKAVITFELTSKIPLYSTNNPQFGELVIGDGSFDLGTQFHVGYRFNRNFVVGFSPGLVLRSSGYESAFKATVFGGASWSPVYIRLGMDSYFSLSKPTTATLIDSNSTAGSGGSFARLSKSQDCIAMGTRLGVFINNQNRIEASAMGSIMGNYAPAYFKVGLNWVADFDLYKPEEPKIKVKEIPFETEQQPLDRSKDSEFGSPTKNSQEILN